MRKSTNTHSIRFNLVGFLQNDHIQIQCCKGFSSNQNSCPNSHHPHVSNPNFLNKHFFLWTTCRIISSESVVDAGLMKIGTNFRNEKSARSTTIQFLFVFNSFICTEWNPRNTKCKYLFWCQLEKKVLVISHQAENRYRIEHQNFSVTFCNFSFFLLFRPFCFSFSTQTHSVLCAIILCRRSVYLNYVQQNYVYAVGWCGWLADGWMFGCLHLTCWLL